MKNDRLVGATIHFSGIVQGVGFRPTVYRKAHQYNLKGSVQNTDTGVFVKVDGTKRSVEGFYNAVLDAPPEMAEIHESFIDFRKPFGFDKFTIMESDRGTEGFTPISPDIATCSDCLKEIFDSEDRRFLYPFTNCTNCGPRFTIIRSIPYDRKNTTMRVFNMCKNCKEEYENPLDRRYHAQPNACWACGPQLSLLLSDGSEFAGNPIKGCIKMLVEGKIVAIKGLGGYHLACDPANAESVKLLRNRKKRAGKPFAIMVRNLDTAKKYCTIGEREEELLQSFERPIVLVERREGDVKISPLVAPDTHFLGIMLPYTPLHHIILEEGPEILIMTSANISEEPLVFRDNDAFKELDRIADAFLVHNRKIERPCDDSVITIVNRMKLPIRRSRGYVPRSINTGISEHSVLATGAFEKNTFCVFKDGKAFVSHYIGDLGNEKSVDAYIKGIRDFLEMFRVKPEAIACDLHPDYMSTIYAGELSEKWEVPQFRVQHHHAHIASVLGEKRLQEKVIGVAFDGTGYGPDGNIWGGEFLLANTEEYNRAGHYAYVSMPGGDKSITEIDRMGVSYLISTYGSLKDVPSFQFLDDVDEERFPLFEKMIRSKVNSPLTSSCGRLFDAVSAMLGICTRPTYDAQGAILLEKEARDLDQSPVPYSYTIDKKGVIHFEPMIKEIVKDIKSGVSKRSVSQKFHHTIVVSGVKMCERIRGETGINSVALSGGVFQNRLILGHFIEQLQKTGFSVLIHSIVPPNDGGISLGQGVVALSLLEKGS